VKVSAVHTNEGRLLQMVGRTIRTDEQQCLSMNTVLTVGLTKMTSEHATVCMTRADK